MRYIGRFKDEEAIQYFVDNFDGEVLDEYQHLNMLVFEYDGEESIFSLDDLKELPGVIYIKEDLLISLDDSIDRSKIPLTKQSINTYATTYLGTIGSAVEYATHLEMLNSKKYNANSDIHDYTTTSTGKNVDCFILDTGILSTNPFVEGRIFKTNFSDSFNVDGTNQEDNQGHGTICAMLVGGDEYGVAKDANMYSLKVLTSEGTGSFSVIIAAINNVIDFHKNKTNGNPSVINMSLGGDPSPDNPTIQEDVSEVNDNPYQEAIKIAVNNGIHVVLAAGNGFNGEDIKYGPMLSKFGNGSLNLSPEQSGNTDVGQGIPIVVGSVDSGSNFLESDPQQMSSFSNYGLGNTINSTGGNLILPVWNVENSENYSISEQQGTSFSAPIVSGLLCLYLEKNPNKTPSEAKQWLVELASRNEINNLMKSNSFTGSFEVSWDLSSKTLTYECIEGSVNFTNNINNGDVVQIIRTGSENPIDLSFINSKIAEINKINEDWWEVTEISQSLIKIKVFTDSTEYTSTDFNGITFNGTLDIQNLENTHESTDGVKLWQRFSTENRLYDELTDAELYLGSLDKTENLRAFNPYQLYTPSWGAVDTLDIKTMFSDSPLNNVKLVTTRNEEVVRPVFQIAGGSLPDGIVLNENGTFSKSLDFVSMEKNYPSIIITISSEYSEPFARVFNIIDSNVAEKQDTTIIAKDRFVWSGTDCDQTSSLSIKTISNISEVIRINEDKCEVWRNDMPENLVPFDTIDSGKIYFVKLAQQINTDIENTYSDGQDMYIKQC
jgi:subtilisin family serine protease